MAAAVPIVGGAIGAVGAIQQGQMTANSLNAQASIQQSDAQESLAAGQYNAMRQGLVSSQKIGQSVAAYGASGVTSASGSEQAVLTASASNAEMDRLNILHNSEVKAINYDNQASLDQYGAASAVQGSYWKAAGSLVGGAISASGAFGGGGNTTTGEASADEMAGGGDEGGFDAASVA